MNSSYGRKLSRLMCGTALALGTMMFVSSSSFAQNSSPGSIGDGKQNPSHVNINAKPMPLPTILASTSIVSEAASHVDLTIGSGFGQIEESRTVTLAAGHNRIQLNGIASQYRDQSLRIISAKGPGSFIYVSASYQPANLTKEKLLQAAVGKQVEVQSKDGVAIVTGKLMSYNNNQLVVVTGSGNTAIYSDQLPVVVPTPDALSNTSSLVIDADVVTAGDYNITFLYESEGLSWSAKHSAIYDDDKSQFSSFESTVALGNESGMDFKEATVWLITGASNGREEKSFRAAYALSAAPGAGADIHAASAENLGERKVYKLPGTVDMTNGQSRLVPLFSAKDVTVKKQYSVNTQAYGYRAGKPTDLSVNATLKIVNSDTDHLGMPIPAGEVKVYQPNSEGHLQVVATTSVNHISKDEPFTIDLGTAGDIRAKNKMTVSSSSIVKATTTTQEHEFQNQKFELTISNYKKEDSSVQVSVGVPQDQDDVLPLVRDSAGLASKSVAVPAGKSETLTYTVKVQTR